MDTPMSLEERRRLRPMLLRFIAEHATDETTLNELLVSVEAAQFPTAAEFASQRFGSGARVDVLNVDRPVKSSSGPLYRPDR